MKGRCWGVFTLVVSVCALLAVARGTSARIILTNWYEPGTGPIAGYSINRFFGKLGPEEIAAGATGLRSVDFEVNIPTELLKFKFAHLNSDQDLDADVYGRTMLANPDPAQWYDPGNESRNIATFVRLASPVDRGHTMAAEDLGGWQPTILEPGGVGSNLSGPSNSGSQVAQRFANLRHLRIAGELLPPAEPDWRAATDKWGTLFAIVVTPISASPGTFRVTLSADQGPATTVTGALFPEPGAPGLLAGAMAVLLGRGGRIGRRA